MVESIVNKHVECTPGVCGGKARIVGHRIRVQDIAVWHEYQGLSADEIVAQFPQITLADVYAALAYYHDHREQIQRQMKEADERVASMIRSSPSKLPTSQAGSDGGDDPVPSG